VHIIPEDEGRPRSADREGQGRLSRIPEVDRTLALGFRGVLTEGAPWQVELVRS